MNTSEKYRITLEVTAEEAEALKGTLLKHSSAVVIEKIQREILRLVEREKELKEIDLYSTYGPNGFGDFLPEHLKK